MDSVTAADDDIVGHFIEDLVIGMSASFQRTVTEADIVLFAGVSGDTNPVHINEEYAKRSFFKGRIAHGMLGAAYISTVLGTKLPGPGAVYIGQNLRFKAPVRPGDTVTARVEVREIIPEKHRAIMQTMVMVGDRTVIDGDATVMLPSRMSRSA
ncbi:MAG: MaoC family dehydratase [Azospirillaceae bacterium]